MADQVKSEVRMVKKGKVDGFVYEVPMNLTGMEKIQYAKDKYRQQMGKRPYKFIYKIIK